MRLPFFYPLATATMKSQLFLWARWTVIGKENVPRRGPLLVVANHLAYADPPLLSACIPRRIVFMAKEELFHGPGSIFIRSFGAFSVRRGMGKDALRQATEVLNAGGVLGMFPEGKRSPDHMLGKAELGAAMIALRSDVPILPVGISGTENIRGVGVVLRRPRITVTIGEPFHLEVAGGHRPTKERLTEATTQLMAHLAKTLPPSYRGIYAEGSQAGGSDGN